MALKRCKECGRPTPSSRRWYCDVCRPKRVLQRERERNRGRVRPDHGKRYGPEHKKLRKRWAPRVEKGVVACARCRRLILPGEPWDLGHVDGHPDRWQGPEHQPAKPEEDEIERARKRRADDLRGSQRPGLLHLPDGSDATSRMRSTSRRVGLRATTTGRSSRSARRCVSRRTVDGRRRSSGSRSRARTARAS
jgi:hypothetical protein